MGNLQITLEEMYGLEYDEWSDSMEERGVSRVDEIIDEAYQRAEKAGITEDAKVYYALGDLAAEVSLLEDELERLKDEKVRSKVVEDLPAFLRKQGF